MDPVVDELQDLQSKAATMSEDGDVAGAEATLRLALAMAAEQRAPSDAVRTEQHIIVLELADLLIRRTRSGHDAFDEAEALLQTAAASATTPSTAIYVRHRLSDLAGRRGDPDGEVRWSREALALSNPDSLRAPRVTIEAAKEIASAAAHLSSCLAAQRRAAEATEIEVIAGAARRTLIADFFRTRDTEPRATQIPPMIAGDDVRFLSSGEVRSKHTIDPEGKPVRGGLRCAQIFGPVVDFTCTCGRYAGPSHVGTTCERCGVEVMSTRTRAGRLGHISLGTSVLHPRWAERVLMTFRISRDTFLQADQEKVTEIETYLVSNAWTGCYDPGMLIDYVPVWPPDAPLPVDRAALDRGYGAMLDAGSDRPTLQRTVDQLFALLDAP